MKGIILAGDSGTKLHPLTLGVPKQLLPLYDKPMVYYPLQTMADSGIIDVLIITSEQDQSSFKRALGDGTEFGVHLSYACQEEPEGIAQAIMIAEEYLNGESLCLMTGDTVIIGESLQKQLAKAYKAADKSGNATIFVDRDYDPNQYGMVVLGKEHSIDIVGSTQKPNYYSITGMYVFPNSVLKHVYSIEKSERDRYEITSVSKIFHDKNKLQIQKLPNDCTWLDTSSFDSILNSSLYIKRL